MVDPFGPGAGQGPSADGAPQVVFILLTHEGGDWLRKQPAHRPLPAPGRGERGWGSCCAPGGI